MPPSAGLSMRNSPRGTSSATRSPYSGRNGHNGSVSYVYRLIEDRKPLFGKGKGPERGIMKHNVWKQQTEQAARYDSMAKDTP